MKKNKFRTFLGNYKKIILVSAICVTIMICVAFLALIAGMKSEISSFNSAQLKILSEKTDEAADYLQSSNSWYFNEASREAESLANLLNLEPDDINDTTQIKRYANNMTSVENVLILDKNRTVIFSREKRNANAADFADDYYDELFESGDNTAKAKAVKGETDSVITCTGFNNGYVVIQCSNLFFKGSDSKLDQIKSIVTDTAGLREESCIAVVDPDSKKVVVSGDEKLLDTRIDIENLDNVYLSKINGDYYAVEIEYNKTFGVYLAALTHVRSIVKSCTSEIFLILFLFILDMVFLIAYVICLRQDDINPEHEFRFLGKYFLESQVKAFRTFAIIVGIITVALFILLEDLDKDITMGSYLQNESAKAAVSYDNYNATQKAMDELYCDIKYDNCNLIGTFTARHPDYLTKQGINKISRATGNKYISILNASGKTICSSLPLEYRNILTDNDSPLRNPGYILMGDKGTKITLDSDLMAREYSIYAVPGKSSSGIETGAIAIIDTDNDSDVIIPSFVSKSAYDNISCFVINKSGKIVHHSDKYYIGKPMKKLGITSDMLRDDFKGHLKNGTQSIIVASAVSNSEKEFVFLAFKKNRVTVESICRVILMALLFIAMSIWIFYDGLGSRYHFQEHKRAVKDADDWETEEKQTWETMSISKKMGRVLSICIYVFSIALIILRILVDQGIVDSEGLGYIVSGNWQKSVNEYSVTANFCLVCIVFTVVRFIKIILLGIESALGASGATFCRLFSNATAYIGAALCLYKIVTNFGVNAAAAVASIGIVGFALTFGAQDLIKDMIAGTFILFEKNYKVGDMLLIDGQWFWVKSIGVRTTRVEAWGQVRVINNSMMTGIINIQDSSASVNCDVLIEHQYDLDDIEKILQRELPELKKNFPPSVSTPTYKGVIELNGNGTRIRIRAYCPPLDQGWVSRDILRELKNIFDRNNINIANDSMVIHINTADKNELLNEMKHNR